MAVADRVIEYFDDGEAYRAWLEINHTNPDGVWVALAKKGSTRRTLSYEDAVLAALCYGWIDGQARRLDDDYYLLGFTPRRRRSPWSRSNVERVAVLAEQGLICPPGQAEIDRAKADGRWAAALEQ